MRGQLRSFMLICFCLLLIGLYNLPIARSSKAANDATIVVALQSEPSLQVVPGQHISYTIRVRNTGDGTAELVEVTLPYDHSALDIQDAFFARDDGWVSEISQETIEVSFVDVDKDEDHTVTLLFLVSNQVAEHTVIPMWAGVVWENEDGDEEQGLSNAAPVVIGSTTRTSPHIVVMVEPERGPQGTVFRFASDRFVPNEPMDAWLNTTTLPTDLDLDLRSDGQGRVEVLFASETLPPGPYSLVLYGVDSELTGVGAFIVDPPARQVQP